MNKNKRNNKINFKILYKKKRKKLIFKNSKLNNYNRQYLINKEKQIMMIKIDRFKNTILTNYNK